MKYQTFRHDQKPKSNSQIQPELKLIENGRTYDPDKGSRNQI